MSDGGLATSFPTKIHWPLSGPTGLVCRASGCTDGAAEDVGAADVGAADVGAADATSDGTAGCDCVAVGLPDGTTICSGTQPTAVTSARIIAVVARAPDLATAITGS